MNHVKLWKRQNVKKVAYFVLHLHVMTDKVSSYDGESIIIIFFISSGVFLEREREENTSSGVFLERERDEETKNLASVYNENMEKVGYFVWQLHAVTDKVVLYDGKSDI